MTLIICCPADMFEKYEMRGIESLTGRMHPNLVKFIGYFKGEDGDGRMRLNFIFERCVCAGLWRQPIASRVMLLPPRGPGCPAPQSKLCSSSLPSSPPFTCARGFVFACLLLLLLLQVSDRDPVPGRHRDHEQRLHCAWP